MSFRRVVLAALVFSFLFVVDDAVACEGCFGPGQTLPGGASASRVTCWTYDEGIAQLCWVEPGYTNCHLQSDDEDACPIGGADEPGGGNDGGGNTGGGGTGGQCHRDASGACPPECTSCGPMNNM